MDSVVSIGLYSTGLTITSSLHTRFLRFGDLKLSDEVPPEGQELLGTLSKAGIAGAVDLGPGYLILIDEQAKAFNYKDVDIWNITKTLILPLKLDLIKPLFGIPNSNSNKKKKNVTESSNDENDPNETTPTTSNDKKPDDISNEELPFVEKVTKTKEVLFSKLGIYTEDLKSSASLSFSKKPAVQRNYDDYYDEDDDSRPSSANTTSSEPADLTDNDSIKVQRSITLRRPTVTSQQTPSVAYKDISKSMLVKFEKQLRSYFDTKDFYYSDQIDLSKELVFKDNEIVNNEKHDDGSFWYNKVISQKFEGTELSKVIINGFINSIDIDLNHSKSTATKRGKLLLISKRSTKRAGLRYLRRGIDDDSNVANFVETSQIFILDQAMEENPLFAKFDILRGSIPLFFQQNPANLKPVPYLTRKPEDTMDVFNKHFKNLRDKYGQVSCISLVERSKRENEIGEAYFKLCTKNDVEISWFDFHKVCKNMKFDNIVQLLDDKLENSCDLTVKQQLINYGWYDSINKNEQLGIFRINCIDCLDRTNLVQKFLSEYIFTHGMLVKYGLSIERPEEFQKKFNNLWADNGDYISRQYASTNALKGDYTRTSKRNYKGLMTDAWLTMSRYYSGYISDYFKQCFIEYLLGIQDSKVFENFESTLDVIDPNDLNENLTKKNSYLKKIIEELEVDSEDLIIVGSWNGFESTLKYNDLKLNDSNEVALILTNKLIFLVRHTDGHIVETLKFPVSDVKEINYGSYFKTTHNSISKNPKRNVGLQFYFEADKEGTGRAISIRFPTAMDYTKIKHIINLISKTCVSATLQNRDIVTLKDAQKNTNVLDVIEHRFKKLVWG